MQSWNKKMKYINILLSLFLFCLITDVFSQTVAPVKIQQLSFDDNKLQIRCNWEIDSSFAAGTPTWLGIVITSSKSDSATPLNSKQVAGLKGDTILKPHITVYDKWYYVQLWLKQNGVWLSSARHVDSVFITSENIQNVELFGNGIDTVLALKNKVWMWKDSAYPSALPVHEDTIITYTVSLSQQKGFIPIGKAVRFVQPIPSFPIYFGLGYDSLPQGVNKLKIGLYRDSSGVIKAEYGSVHDTVKKIIYVKTGRISDGFVLLSDTIRPSVSWRYDQRSDADTGILYDTMLIQDNSINSKWMFYTGTNAQELKSPSVIGFCSDTITKVILPTRLFGSQIGGINSIVYISDGVNKDTIDFSRTFIKKVNTVLTNDNYITPVFSPVILGKPDVRSCLNALFTLSGDSYDKRIFRLYRWYPSAVSPSVKEKWVEYSTVSDTVFTFAPGALFWIQTAKSHLIDLGSGTTIDTKKSFVINLFGQSWTDIGMPVGINSTTTEFAAYLDRHHKDLIVYEWLRDDVNKTYNCELVYGTSAIGAVQDSLQSMSGRMFTIYNNQPVPIALSVLTHTYKELNKSGKTNNNHPVKYKITVTGNDGKKESVYAAFSDEIRECLFYPKPQGFSKPIIAIGADKNTEYGLAIIPLQKDKDRSIAIRISNTGEFQKKYYLSVEQNDDHNHFSVGKYQELLLGPHEEVVVNVSLQSGQLKQIVDGSQMRFDVRGFKNKLFVKNRGASDNEEYSVDLYTIAGRKVYSKKFINNSMGLQFNGIQMCGSVVYRITGSKGYFYQNKLLIVE
jgi:hypothetical protein